MLQNSFYTNPPFSLYVKNIKEKNNLYKHPILMIHGSGYTGHCYEYSPDGRKGIGYYFAKNNFDVYIIDWPNMGRSGFIPYENINGLFFVKAIKDLINIIGKKVIILCHSMSCPIIWKLPDLINNNKISKIIALAPGEMGNIQKQPEYIQKSKNVYEIIFGSIKYFLDLSKLYIPTDDYINKKLIGNSRQFPIKFINKYKATIQATNSNLIFERFNIKNSQLKIDNIKKYKNIDILIVTGTNDIDHPKDKDKQIADYFTSKNIKAAYYYLGDFGIYGNGHMLMIEKNNYKISDKIIEWINLK